MIVTATEVFPKVNNSSSTSSSGYSRLFLVLFLSAGEGVFTPGVLAEFEGVLRAAGCSDLSALEHAKRMISVSRMLQGVQPTTSVAKPPAPAPKSPGNSGVAAFEFLSRVHSLGTQITGQLVSSMKALLPGHTFEAPICKMIDSAIRSLSGESGNISSTNTWLIRDPRKSADNQTSTVVLPKSSINHIMIFIVGGSNYDEYDYVLEAMSEKYATTAINPASHSQQGQPMAAAGLPNNINNVFATPMPMTFGSTELLNAEQFLAILSKLN